MKILLTLLVLLFSSSVFADQYPYDGKTPLLKNLSKTAGEDYGYMKLCGGKLYKNAKETFKFFCKSIPT